MDNFLIITIFPPLSQYPKRNEFVICIPLLLFSILFTSICMAIFSLVYSILTTFVGSTLIRVIVPGGVSWVKLVTVLMMN